MTGDPDLSGYRILVVEDEYLLAADISRALHSAGAEVTGPSPDEKSARAELKLQRPDAVVLDINLGQGPSFRLAKTLQDQSIPFVVLTGYDSEVIPKEFHRVESLQKPIDVRRIVNAISGLLTPVA